MQQASYGDTRLPSFSYNAARGDVDDESNSGYSGDICGPSNRSFETRDSGYFEYSVEKSVILERSGD